jgi:hypothetical protein
MIILRATSSCLTTLGGAVLAVVLAYCLASVFNPDMQAHAEPHPFTIRDLTAVQRVGDLSVSPNGQLAAFTVRKWVRWSRTRTPHTTRHTSELLLISAFSCPHAYVKEWHEHDDEPAHA